MGLFNLFKKSRKATLVNGTLTVALNDASHTDLVLFDSTKADYEYVLNKDHSDNDVLAFYHEKNNIHNDKKTVSQIIQNKENQKRQKTKEEKETRTEIEVAKVIASEYESKFPIAVSSGDFTENNGSLYLKQVPDLSIPKLLVTKFITLLKEIDRNNGDALDEYCALKNFWLRCSLNPNPESRENLFRFIQNNGLKCNKYGFFVAYRSVDKAKKVTENTITKENQISKIDSDLSEFISLNFTKIKGQKKSPKNFWISRNEDSQLRISKSSQTSEEWAEWVILGNLADLYQDLSINEASIETPSKSATIQTYTDAHTHTMDIRIGKEVSIDPKTCDWDNSQECSSGLHVGSKDYGCGNTHIMVLVDPMKVVAVPYEDGHKMRVWAYYPLCVLNESDRFTIHNTIDTLELGTEYYENSMKEMKKLLEENTPKELKTHKLMNDLSPKALELIAKEITNIPEILSKRVVKG